jgi:iron complex transport system ATP-binding protein
MVLAQESPVLLLDEPTSALDLGHQVEVLDLVRRVAAGGRIVVMVLHDLASAARYADLLVAIRDGRVVASGPPRDVVDAGLVRRLYDIDADILAAPADGAPVVVPSPSRPGKICTRSHSGHICYPSGADALCDEPEL